GRRLRRRRGGGAAARRTRPGAGRRRRHRGAPRRGVARRRHLLRLPRRGRAVAGARDPRAPRRARGRARRDGGTMSWLLLLGAIITEVGATFSLRMSATGDRRWYLPVAVGYLAAFALLSGALAPGLPPAVAYGIWGAFGIVATPVPPRTLSAEPLPTLTRGGMGLI